MKEKKADVSIDNSEEVISAGKSAGVNFIWGRKPGTYNR